MRQLRLLALVVLGALFSSTGAAPAAGQIGAPTLNLLEPVDATELAALLAEATKAQGVCYGWNVHLTDHGLGNAVRDFGSNHGVATTVDDCDRYVVFRASITYTSESSEAEDSASIWVESNLTNAPDDSDLRRAGVHPGDLLGERDDLAIINGTSALPLLTAERGAAAPIALEPNQTALPAGDGPTGTPGSDWTRTNGAALCVAAVLLGLAALWTLTALTRPDWLRKAWE